jgi:hypothetical protein
MKAVLARDLTRRRSRPTWWHAVCAVIGGSIVGFVAAFVALIPFYSWLPIQFTDGMTGRGWPWRIEGLWSFAADVGPLLFCGGAFAFGAEAFISRHTRIACRRAPIALAAATVGWVSLGGVSRAGLLAADGVLPFVVIVVVVREASVHERTLIRWTRARAAAAVGAGLVLALTSISYGLLHPLTAGSAELGTQGKRGPVLHASLHNDGDAKVTLLGASVPGIDVLRARTIDETVGATSAIDDQMRPVAGATIAGDGLRDIQFELPTACASTVIDRIDVRLRVRGRTLDQVVRLAPPVPLACP